MKDMDWLVFALMAIAGFALYNFFVKQSSDKITAPVGVAIIGGAMVAVALVAILFMHFSGQEITITSQGIKFALLAGLFTALAEMAYFLMFMRGTNLTIGLPLVVGGTVAGGAILGFVFLSEALPLVKLIGVLTTLAGIILLSVK